MPFLIKNVHIALKEEREGKGGKKDILQMSYASCFTFFSLLLNHHM